MSAIDVIAGTTIAAPRDEVARYVMDHRNDPVWIGGIKESELSASRPSRWARACGGSRRSWASGSST